MTGEPSFSVQLLHPMIEHASLRKFAMAGSNSAHCLHIALQLSKIPVNIQSTSTSRTGERAAKVQSLVLPFGQADGVSWIKFGHCFAFRHSPQSMNSMAQIRVILNFLGSSPIITYFHLRLNVALDGAKVAAEATAARLAKHLEAVEDGHQNQLRSALRSASHICLSL